MISMSPDRVADLLQQPLQAVLSVARRDKGPVAVPMSYHFTDGMFWMVTDPASLHGRLMVKRGRATITVQYEACDGRNVHQWYVMAEGAVSFLDDPPEPHVRRILAKDRGEENADDWMRGAVADGHRLAILEPDRIAGHEWSASLD